MTVFLNTFLSNRIIELNEFDSETKYYLLWDSYRKQYPNASETETNFPSSIFPIRLVKVLLSDYFEKQIIAFLRATSDLESLFIFKHPESGPCVSNLWITLNKQAALFIDSHAKKETNKWLKQFNPINTRYFAWNWPAMISQWFTVMCSVLPQFRTFKKTDVTHIAQTSIYIYLLERDVSFRSRSNSNTVCQL